MIRSWLPVLAGTLALAQGGPPFVPDRPPVWQPEWEFSAHTDRLTGSDAGPDGLGRTGAQLRLRWTAPWRSLDLAAGTRSAAGSDGNRFNGPRWDQQPSNGTRLDLARVQWTGSAPAGFGRIRLGFQDNLLLASQALWDRDLRFLGGAAAGGWRSAGGRIPEAGLRAEAGRVRHLLGGEVRLAAVQGVLKIDTGPWSVTAHAARWHLAWNPGPGRLAPRPGTAGRQSLDLDAWGAGVRRLGPVPLDIQAMQARNPDTGATSEELMAGVGGLERPWRPRIQGTWQRLSATGTLYPVNGDQWWYFRAARGARLELSLPLPRRWLLSFAYLSQREDGTGDTAVRRGWTLTKRF
jgi:hypothetical protein